MNQPVSPQKMLLRAEVAAQIWALWTKNPAAFRQAWKRASQTVQAERRLRIHEASGSRVTSRRVQEARLDLMAVRLADMTPLDLACVNLCRQAYALNRRAQVREKVETEHARTAAGVVGRLPYGR